MNRQYRTAGNFRNVGAGVDHNGDDRSGEGVDTQIVKCHRERKVDKHHLDDDRRSADHFNENQRDVVGDPTAK